MKNGLLKESTKLGNLVGHLQSFITELYGNEDWLTDPSMQDTAKRMAKMYMNEFCYAKFNKEPKMSIFPREGKAEMLCHLGPISFVTMCEHHFLPIYGKAYVGYYPDENVLGLSKFCRLLHYMS